MDINIPVAFKDIFDPHRYKVYYGGRGSGKCFAGGTKVIMFDGTLKKVEDIVVGDILMGPDSSPRRVLETHSGFGKLYKVNQTSGISYVVNDQHILTLKKSESSIKAGRYPDCPKICNISMPDYLEKSARWKSNFRGFKTDCIDFPSQEILIDPYFLGLWLGDGTARELRITNMDQEVFDYCKEFASRYGFEPTFNKKDGEKACDIGFPYRVNNVNPIWQNFLKYDLKNNKHIPQAYLSNSREVRLALLAGVLDSDGFTDGNCVSITQKNERLIREIKFLADSLGFRTKLHPKVAKCCNTGKLSDVWVLSISGEAWKIPLKVERKKVKKEDARSNKDWHLSMVSVEENGTGEWFGFSVDVDHLFLLEDCTVVHNSWAAAMALLILGRQKKLRILCAREFQYSIADSVHRLLCNLIYDLGWTDFYSITKTLILGKNGTEFTFKGLHANVLEIKSTEGINICWVEEAQTVSEDSWQVLIPTIRSPGSEIWVTFNPLHEDDPTYKRFVLDPPPNSIVKKVNWNGNPWFPDVLKEEMEHLKKTDYDLYMHVWEGECKKLSGALIFGNKFVVKEFETPNNVRFYHGVDWGFAKDPTALVRCWIRDNTLYIDAEAYGVGVELDDTPQLFDKVPTARRWPVKADSARPETISYVRRKGFPISAAKKWSGSIEDGIEFIRSFDEIVIHPKCVHTIEEFSKYSYKVDKQTNEILPVPEDKYNHCIDALRYSVDSIIKGHGLMRIRSEIVQRGRLDGTVK